MKNKILNYQYGNTEQAIMPQFFSEYLDILDPVITFDKLMEGIDVSSYIDCSRKNYVGRIGYNPVNMFKTVLFGFMDKGYISTRELEDECKVNIRYMYLMNHERPTYRTFAYFIKDYLSENIEEVFKAVIEQINKTDAIDFNHVYIDGSKFEANANKYTWVWKKATEKSRYRLYEKITELIDNINDNLAYLGLRMETNTEYVPEYLHELCKTYASVNSLDIASFKSGKGYRKSNEQRNYEKLYGYACKLEEYVEKLNTCGTERNSYSKTDHSATFMRMKTDYMGNDQLLPAYNVQFAVADEYIVTADVNHYRADMDCFVPLMNKFKEYYGFYPEYPVADAGYGSYNNYLFCEEHGMKKYMKFTMYEKEIHDINYRNNPYRIGNFQRDEAGFLICPNNKRFTFKYRKNVRGNNYGRQEEVYECEDCSNCPYAAECKKGEGNRKASLNTELTSMHEEVIENLGSIQGALLRMNRSIQSEGTFGIIKQDRFYKRIVRKGIKSVKLEILLVSIGFNLKKFHCKKMRNIEVA